MIYWNLVTTREDTYSFATGKTTHVYRHTLIGTTEPPGPDRDREKSVRRFYWSHKEETNPRKVKEMKDDITQELEAS